LVLVVDDETPVRVFLQQSLEHLGYRCEVAASGFEALTRLETSPFNLVLTDLGMPNMNGEELAREIKRRTPNLPVLLVTGWADLLQSESKMPEGVDMVLGKPVTLDQLSTALASLCKPH
jgi:CheY-like chemotaxis protein